MSESREFDRFLSRALENPETADAFIAAIERNAKVGVLRAEALRWQEGVWLRQYLNARADAIESEATE